jgi:hypothetical protein
MKKTILTVILISVILFGAYARWSLLGWLMLVGFISVGVFGLIHLLVHLRYLKMAKDFRPIDYFLVGCSHLFFLGIFLFQSDFGDDEGAVVMEAVFGTIPILHLSQTHGTYLTICIAAYFIWTGLIIFRIKRIDKTFSTRKVLIWVGVIIMIIAIPVVTIYVINVINNSKNTRKEEKNGHYDNLDRALQNIPQVKYLRLYKHPDSYTEIPDGVFKLTELETLEMYSNQISTIPKEISSLTKLKHLNLQYNLIEEIPNEVFQLKNLEEMVLLNNDLKSLSPEICKCTSLKTIQVSGHSLNALPLCMKDMTNLEELVIQSDSINILMEDLKQFKNLKKLSVFGYGNAQIDDKKYEALKEELKDTKLNW